MAYDTLKTEIRQYIQTNGQQEITGQILQNVLLDMVNAYPSLDGYATQQWVQNQLGDMATMTWVGQNFVQNSALNNYLPLSGGTLTGFIGAGTLSTGSYSLSNTGLSFDYSYNGSPRYAHAIRISSVDGTITFYGRGMTVGTVIDGDKITSGKFIVTNGTSSQFLKADGSVDSNTYITASALDGYLPLTGGTLTGDLIINSGEKSYFTIYGSVGDGYGAISVDVDGLFINAANTSGGNVYLNPDVVVGRSLDVYANLYVDRNAYIDNECHAASFVQTSDITKKNIIGNVGLSLHDVANAPLFDFTWKDSKDQRNHVGTSAQYWQSVMPQVVSDATDALGLQYDVAALAGVITVAKRVVDHEDRISAIERKLNIN